jgi:ABC-type bacteriocin/lantibiotic exporter with double-glycine peptidase domain
MMIAVVAVAACLAAAPPAAPSLADTALRLEVPTIRQAPERCGPAALSMVLRFYGASEAELAEADRAYDPALRGALITDLRDAAHRAGRAASVETPGEAGLHELLRQRVPPILLFDGGVGRISRGHYGVLTAWDPAHRLYTVNDGGAKPHSIGRDDLMRRWHAAGEQALVVRPEAP